MSGRNVPNIQDSILWTQRRDPISHKPETLKNTLVPKPETLNPTPLNPKPETLNPKPFNPIP